MHENAAAEIEAEIVQLEELDEQIRATPADHLAERIRAARRLARLSHDRLAARVGSSRSHLIKLEKGIHRPRAALLVRIADATERDLGDFLDPSSNGDTPGGAS